jgi:hypothetical protein
MYHDVHSKERKKRFINFEKNEYIHPLMHHQ